MPRALLIAGLICSVPLVAPASAQITISGLGQGGGGERGLELLRQLNRVDRRIDRERDNGRISRREARALDREARQIRTLGTRYAQGGLSPAEANELQFRAAALNSLILSDPSPAAGSRDRR